MDTEDTGNDANQHRHEWRNAPIRVGLLISQGLFSADSETAAFSEKAYKVAVQKYNS